MDAETRAVIELLVEVSIDSAFKWSATEEESAKLESAIDEACKLLEGDGWIRVEDALPENRKAKIVWCPSNLCQFMAYFDDGVWCAWYDGGLHELMQNKVTHWRELEADPAQPPKESK